MNSIRKYIEIIEDVQAGFEWTLAPLKQEVRFAGLGTNEFFKKSLTKCSYVFVYRKMYDVKREKEKKMVKGIIIPGNTFVQVGQELKIRSTNKPAETVFYTVWFVMRPDDYFKEDTKAQFVRSCEELQLNPSAQFSLSLKK